MNTCPRCDLPANACQHRGHVAPPTTTERIDAATTLLDDLRHGRLVSPRARPRMRVVHAVAYQEPTPTSAPVDLGSGRDILLTLHDYVTELIEPTTQVVPFDREQENSDGSITTFTEKHRTCSVPLLEQLDSAAEQSGSTESGRRSFDSKPSASVEAIDAISNIEIEAYRWLKNLGVKDPHDTHPELRDAVRHLRALAADVENCGRLRGRHDKDGWCCKFHQIEKDVRSWWVQARVLTGWDQPAWRPANTCPLCGIKGGLRIRRDATGAVCVECRETWSEDSIGLLAEHIRTENHEDEAEAVG